MLRRLIGEDIQLRDRHRRRAARPCQRRSGLPRPGAHEHGRQCPRRDAARRHADHRDRATSCSTRRRPPHGAPPGSYVRVSVTDTGTGMTDERPGAPVRGVLHHEAKGEGTGLGLATCLTIVQQSRWSHPRPERGRTRHEVRRLLPARRGRPSRSSSAPVRWDRAARHRDGADRRRRAVGAAAGPRALEALGYDVLSASNGHDGLRVASAHRGAPIRLVVTDVDHADDGRPA